MPCNHDTAVDEMIARIAPVLDTQGIPTKYPNGPEPDRTAGAWARVTFRHGDSGRATIGTRRERHDGHLYVQYFFPLGSGATLLYSLPQAMLNALVDFHSPSGVWLRKVTLLDDGEEDVAAEDGFYDVTIKAQFQYDEFRGK